MFTIHHLSLSVKNIDVSVEFYEMLGFRKVSQWDDSKNNFTIVLLKLQEIYLELLCFKRFQSAPETAKLLSTDLPRIGMKHFALNVKSIHAAKKHVLKNNLADSVEINHGLIGMDYFFIKDPSGNFVEFIQDDRGKLE